MMEDYHLEAEESNFLVIDKRGLIRYAAAGRIDRGQFEPIKDLLSTLARDE